jgi:RimJ/RimL family protein N-acetyltransferase
MMPDMNWDIETPRLVLREFVETDAAMVLALLNEPSFHEFIGDRGVRTIDDARRYLREGPIASYAEHGHGLLWMGLKQANAEPAGIGMCGLVRRPSLPGPDIGFAVTPVYWGVGYTTEGATAVLSRGREKLAITSVYGITLPHNHRSIRVLEKLGLQFVEEKSLNSGASPVHIFRGPIFRGDAS